MHITARAASRGGGPALRSGTAYSAKVLGEEFRWGGDSSFVSRGDASVPAAAVLRAQHFRINVGPAVSQHLVESVPVPLAAGIGEIDARDQDFLAIVARRAGDRPAGIARDQALADEGLAALGADPVGGGDEERIGMRIGHDDDVGHGLALWILARDRHPVGRHAQDFGALQVPPSLKLSGNQQS